MSRIPKLMFVTVLLISAALLACLTQHQPQDGHGVPHPRFAAMDQGGTSDRHDWLILPAGLYGGLQIVLFTAALYLAVGDRPRALPALAVGGLCYLAVFVAMVATYAWGMEAAPRVFGVPLATSLMTIGMWCVPVVFVVLYIAKFDSWIYGEQEAKAFAELLAGRDRQASTRSKRHG